MIRVLVVFEGRVQGVGFRMTTRRLAANFPLVGFVRNLDDGRVELVVEGDPGDATRLIRAVEAEFAGSITGRTEVSGPPADPPLVGFTIR